MANDIVGKHMVCVQNPTGRRLSITYSTLKEAQSQARSLERSGYTILEILPTSLPKPNI